MSFRMVSAWFPNVWFLFYVCFQCVVVFDGRRYQDL